MTYEQLKLENQVCFRLYTASRLITQGYRPFLDKLGITYPQYLVLMILWEKNNMLKTDIQELLMLESNTVTPLLQRMEKEGLIIRTNGPANNRQKLISLTKKGKELKEQAKDIPSCLLENMQNCGVDLEKIKNLIPGLDEIICKFHKENM